MAYFAEQIANYFLKKGWDEDVPVDQLKVQKLVYFAHGWHLAFTGEPLISEGIEAWKYGPVVRDLYRHFRQFGSASIKQLAPVAAHYPPLDARTTALLDEVWKKYGRIGGIELSALTHERGYAWNSARRGHENDWDNPTIPDDWIKDEFTRRLSA